MNFDDDSGAGIYFKGIFEGGSDSGQLAHFSFPIELITEDKERKELLERVFNLFGVISSSEEIAHSGIPGSFELYQNYPNPFNPTTIINYELQITNYVDLSIYNLNGRKVTTLISGEQKAGHHQVKWNATGYASGIYYYKISAGEFQDVRKMILLR